MSNGCAEKTAYRIGHRGHINHCSFRFMGHRKQVTNIGLTVPCSANSTNYSNSRVGDMNCAPARATSRERDSFRSQAGTTVYNK